MNLTELLDTTAKRWPQKPAIIEDGVVLSYGGLAQQVGEFAQQISALGGAQFHAAAAMIELYRYRNLTSLNK